ncbi:MAG: ABC transporter ATP-binding protein, partial [Ilumatobacteraceae bacterium]
MSLLSVEELTTWFRTGHGTLRAVTDVSLVLDRGQTLGIVGESGSGKSVLMRSIMRIQQQARVARSNGKVWFDGRDLMTLSTSQLRQVWRRQISIVPQNPLSSLNPVIRVGKQIEEILHYSAGIDGKEGRARATELLDSVGIPEPARRLRSYPHELSGGMRQRVAIAMAVACEPDLLIADEPTTALDVTVQAQILALLRRLQAEHDMAMIFVSHDLAVVSGLADEIAVMYAGRIAEVGPAKSIVHEPRMPYSAALLDASPRLDQPRRTALAAIPGRPPNMVLLPTGCAFHPRCPRRTDRCDQAVPPLENNHGPTRFACWNPLDRHGR